MAQELASGVLASAVVGMDLALVVVLVVLASYKNISVISRLVKTYKYFFLRSGIEEFQFKYLPDYIHYNHSTVPAFHNKLKLIHKLTVLGSRA